jgi:hypothetical protein
MPIRPFTPELEPKVRAFNERLEAGGSHFAFPRTPADVWLPKKGDTQRTFMEAFVSTDAEASVRGGYVVKHQPFWVAGSGHGVEQNVDNLQLPLSEGSVDPKFSGVGVQILAHVQKQYPLLYCLGMGGLENPLPMMLKSMGWTLVLVPFLFRVTRGRGFLRNISVLRTSASRRIAADILACSGLGGLVLRSMHIARTRPSIARFTYVADEVPGFDAWADVIWGEARAACTLCANRSAAELELLYPRDKEACIRVRVSHAGKPVGWAVVFATGMTKHRQFGAMKLGTVIDCLAVPGHEGAVVRAATRALRKRTVDLVATNQLHHAWVTAFRHAGFLSGPSNYVFASSKKLTAAIAPWGEAELPKSRVHITRGDGDGPIHL